VATPSCSVVVVAVFLPGLGEMIVKDREATLLRSGERMPPWGVPVIVSLSMPSRIRHGFEERLDQTQDTLVSDSGSQRSMRPICEISSKQAFDISSITTHMSV